jgi:DUF4097 and DUF4098 domain-containing protein YvlB
MTNERMMILEMVNEGKITPEEALTLLNALGGADSEAARAEWVGVHAGHGGF